MKNLVLSFLSQVSRKGWLLLLVVLQILFMSAFHGLFSFSVEKIMAVSGGIGMPDTRMFYTFQELEKTWAAFGPAGRHMYLQLQQVDMFYPLVYSTLLAGLMFLVYRNTRLRYTVFLPFTAALFDYAENILLRISVLSYPHLQKWIARTAGVVTFVKWFLIFLSVFFLLFGALWLVIQEIKARRTR
jgi:uncharacterized membrane protein